ncbi:hypothetical protein [Spiroplasma litorale]|uniref:hypothetical protein n=1 Tax=Spiroplasma litorale TaxID=216942 RepID=UPI00094635A0|nr:hypothetical protein [Spiroplasma litorale]
MCFKYIKFSTPNKKLLKQTHIDKKTILFISDLSKLIDSGFFGDGLIVDINKSNIKQNFGLI